MLIGPMPLIVGGDSVKFSSLVTELRRGGRFDVRVVDTSRRLSGRWIRNPLTGLKTIVQLLSRTARADLVVFHASDRGIATFGPVVFAIARAYGKRIIVRAFGGSIGASFLRLSAPHRWLLKRTILSSDACLFQTKHLVRFFERQGVRRVEWFANYTDRLVPPAQPDLRRCRRLFFLGQVRTGKGIDVLLKSAALLPEGTSIDIFGPLYDYSRDDLETLGGPGVRYRGILSQDEVTTRLWEYDAMVFPTVHEGEGYPGAILEAFSHGLPVIATRWNSIPELVDDTCGILIEPRNPQALADAAALLHTDNRLFERLKAGAWQRSRLFPTDVWTARFVEICDSVLENSTGKRDAVCAAL